MSYYNTLNELYSSSWAKGILPRSQQQYLQQLRQEQQLGEIEARLIDRMFHAVRRGWLRVV